MYNFSIHICTYIWSICIESPVNADIFIRRIWFTTNDRAVLGHFLKFTIYSFTITPLYSHNNIASVFLCITYDSFLCKFCVCSERIQFVCNNSTYIPSFVPFERTQCLNFWLIFLLYKIMLSAGLFRGNVFDNQAVFSSIMLFI